MTIRHVALLAVAGALLYGGAIALAATSDHSGAGVVVLAIAAGLSFTATGVVATLRRPHNRTGVLMLAVGYLWALGALQLTRSSVLFSIGSVFEQLAFAPLAQLLLSYPSGRLEIRRHRRLVGAVWITVFLGPILVGLFERHPTRCSKCPSSALLVDNDHALGVTAEIAFTVAAVALALIALFELARRYRSAGPPLRRTLGPVYGMFFFALVFIIGANIVGAVSDATGNVLGAIAIGGIGFVPIAFLVGLLRSRLARGSVVELIMDLDRGAPLHRALAAALGDPSLEVAYKLEDRNRWVDAEGRRVVEPVQGPTRSVTMVERHGEQIAALTHDASLDDEPDLVQGVAATAALALRAERLQAELRNQYELLITLVDTAPSLLVTLDLEGTILNQNVAVLEASGYDDEEQVRGRAFWEVFGDPENRREMRRAFEAAAPEFTPAEYENSFVNLRGRQRVIAWRSAPVRDEAGEIVSVLAAGIDITDRKRQETDWRASEERLRAVIQSSPVAIVEVDLENRVLTWNPGAQRIFGWTADDVAGRRVPIIGPEHEAESSELDRRIRAGEVIAGLETTRKRKDGSNVDVEVAAAPVRGSDGRSVGLIALYLDVTERKRRELELQRERDATETLVQTIPTLIVVVDENAYVLLDEGRAGINRAFKDRLGWSDEDVGDKSLLEFIHPDDAYAAVMGIASAANGVPAVERKSRWRRADGDSVVVEWTATPMPDTSMRARRLVLISATDVTERAEHEEELRRQRDFLGTVARSTPSLMAVVDSDAVVSSEGVNRAFEENIGYGDADAEGHPIHELIGAVADAATFIRALTPAGTGVEHETTWTSRYGEALRIAWSTLPLDLGYEQPRFLVHGIDMTERNRQQDEIRASRTRIVQAADDARRKLERNLHDGAQQRLVALSVSLRLAEAKLASDPDSAASILAAAREELAHALEELRELARGIHPAVLTDRGLPAAIESLVARTPLPVEAELPAERLPPAVEAALYYVVSESLANVVKYAGATAVSVRIELNGDGTVTAEVSDDGVGGADPSRGSGLRGLADRIEALDGRLRVESPEGGGTRVRVEVPIPAEGATTTVDEAAAR